MVGRRHFPPLSPSMWGPHNTPTSLATPPLQPLPASVQHHGSPPAEDGHANLATPTSLHPKLWQLRSSSQASLAPCSSWSPLAERRHHPLPTVHSPPPRTSTSTAPVQSRLEPIQGGTLSMEVCKRPEQGLQRDSYPRRGNEDSTHQSGCPPAGDRGQTAGLITGPAHQQKLLRGQHRKSTLWSGAAASHKCLVCLSSSPRGPRLALQQHRDQTGRESHCRRRA